MRPIPAEIVDIRERKADFALQMTIWGCHSYGVPDTAAAVAETGEAFSTVAWDLFNPLARTLPPVYVLYWVLEHVRRGHAELLQVG